MASHIKAARPVFLQGVHYVTSAFGKRTYYMDGKRVSDFHNGIDLVGKNIASDYVVAIADGTVTETLNNVQGKKPSEGNYVKICHDGGEISVYYHLKVGSVAVRAGERVKGGAVLGYMGTSGNSTGPHLHFGLLIGGQWVDPTPYLKGERSIVESTAFQPGFISAVNTRRCEDSLVLYENVASTGTNKWGVEVALDKNGIALSDPVYGVGNMAVPPSGKVLSGHGRAGAWLIENIKGGYLARVEKNRITVKKGVYRTVLYNSKREADALVVYDKGGSAPTNIYGYEVAVDKNGRALADPVYGKGKSTIPKGGFVLSGHGRAGSWLYGKVKKGTAVIFEKASCYIKAEK